MKDANPAGFADRATEFSPLRSVLFPVHGYEMKKFFALSFLMFFILFVYTMVRDFKNSLVQYYAVLGGAELFSQLKFFFVMPAAFLLVMLYSFLINKFGFNKTFYIMVSSFMSFYIVFILFLFPNRAYIHPGEDTVRAIQASCPSFLYWMIPCITNWSITLFYIFSELWGTIALSSLFWQLAYRVTMKNEVKRFFGLYAVIGNGGVVASGGLLKWISKECEKLNHPELSIYICVIACIVGGLIVMGLYWYVNSIVLKDPRCFDVTQIKENKKKEKIGAMDGIKILFRSSYLMLIGLIVVCYGTAINFAEIIWEAYMKIYFPDPNQYQSMRANLSMLVGVLTIVAAVIGQNIIRKTKWRTAALVPAAILVVFGGLFFGVVLYGNYVSTFIFGINFVVLAVWFGLIQDALSRSVKYCLFDATKNMAYLPLDNETRTKGQAAVEVIGGRAGKGGASLIQAILTGFIATGSTLIAHIIVIAIIFAFTGLSWICSVFKLSKKYEAKVAEKT